MDRALGEHLTEITRSTSIPVHNIKPVGLPDRYIDRLLNDIKPELVQLFKDCLSASAESAEDSINDQDYEPGFKRVIEEKGWKIMAVVDMSSLPGNFEGQRLLEGVLDVNETEEEEDTKKATTRSYNSYPLMGRCSLYVQRGL